MKNFVWILIGIVVANYSLLHKKWRSAGNDRLLESGERNAEVHGAVEFEIEFEVKALVLLGIALALIDLIRIWMDRKKQA